MGFNWGQAAGGLADIFRTIAAGQEEQRQAETLRQLFDQQRQQLEQQRVQMGLTAGPPAPPGLPMSAPATQVPQQDQGFLGSLGGALNNMGRLYGAGLRPGSPEIDALKFQLQGGQDEMNQMRTLAAHLAQLKQSDQLQRDFLQYKNQMPMPAAKQQELDAVTAREKAMAELHGQQQMQALNAQMARQQALENMRYQNDLKLRGVPQATAPTWEEKLFGQMSPEQKQQYLGMKSLSARRTALPSIALEGTDRVARDPLTGQEIWRTAGAAEKPIPAAANQRLIALGNIINELAHAGDMLNNGADAYLGPVRGRAGQVIDATGQASPQESIFRQTMGNLSDIRVRERTGAVSNESEIKGITNTLPRMTDPPEVWRARQQNALRELGNLYRSTLGAYKNYAVPDELLAPLQHLQQMDTQSKTGGKTQLPKWTRDAQGNLVFE